MIKHSQKKETGINNHNHKTLTTSLKNKKKVKNQMLQLQSNKNKHAKNQMRKYYQLILHLLNKEQKGKQQKGIQNNDIITKLTIINSMVLFPYLF